MIWRYLFFFFFLSPFLFSFLIKFQLFFLQKKKKKAACFGLIKLNTEGHIEDYFSSLQEGRGDRYSFFLYFSFLLLYIYIYKSLYFFLPSNFSF